MDRGLVEECEGFAVGVRGPGLRVPRASEYVFAHLLGAGIEAGFATRRVSVGSMDSIESHLKRVSLSAVLQRVACWRIYCHREKGVARPGRC